MNTRNLSHDFCVKLSPCICSHTSGEDLSRYLLIREKSCFVQGQISLLLAQARPTMMNHHNSIIRVDLGNLNFVLTNTNR